MFLNHQTKIAEKDRDSKLNVKIEHLRKTKSNK